MRLGQQPLELAVLLDRHADLGLPKKTNDLFFAVVAWFACPSFSRLMDSLEKWLVRFRGSRSPLGKYWRSRPLAFSLVPRCHGLLGSQK